MSVPTSLKLPSGVDARQIETPRGTFAAHEAHTDGTSHGHVLLIPGFTGSKEDFTPVLRPLADAGFDVTTYDQRGQFETAGTADDDYSLAGFAADALAVRASSGVATSHFLGHSFGGLVAQNAVLADVDVSRSLSLLCTGPRGFERDSQKVPLEQAIGLADTIGLAQLHELREAGKQRQPPPEIAEFLRRRFTSNGKESLKAIARALIDSPDRVDEIAALRLPTWVGRGRDDDAWPHDVQDEMARRLGDEVHVIDMSAHSPAVENPSGTVDALLSFWSDV